MSPAEDSELGLQRGKQHPLPLTDVFWWGNALDEPVRRGKANLRECCNGAVKQSGTGMLSFGNGWQSGEGWFMLWVECKDMNLTEREREVSYYFNFVGTVKAWASCLKPGLPQIMKAMKRKVSTNVVLRFKFRDALSSHFPPHLPTADLH